MVHAACATVAGATVASAIGCETSLLAASATTKPCQPGRVSGGVTRDNRRAHTVPAQARRVRFVEEVDTICIPRTSGWDHPLSRKETRALITRLEQRVDRFACM